MSIASALFSDSQTRLFQWLFGQPHRTFHLAELGRLTGLGSASLQRELNRLADAALITSDRVGNLRRFQANLQSPVSDELISLTRKTMGAGPVISQALQPLSDVLNKAWLYGSVAKQSENAQSDIDVMLVGDGLQLSQVLDLLLPAEALLGRKINPLLFTVAEFAKRRNEADSFVSRVMSQPLINLLGSPHEPAST
jgi:predicted nucleotidyltransferase